MLPAKVQLRLSRAPREADPAIIEQAGEVGPAPEHIIDGLQDLGGAREGFSLVE